MKRQDIQGGWHCRKRGKRGWGNEKDSAVCRTKHGEQRQIPAVESDVVVGEEHEGVEKDWNRADPTDYYYQQFDSDRSQLGGLYVCRLIDSSVVNVG